MTTVERCLQKKRYLTRQLAKKAQKERSMKFNVKLYVYECEKCGLWHLSHINERDGNNPVRKEKGAWVE